MTGPRTRISRALLRHAAATMPRRRSDWGRAMLAEVEELPPEEQLAFARGCVLSSYRERLSDPATMLAAGRWTVASGLGAATLVCVLTADRLRDQQGATMILILGMICLAAAGAFVWRGVRTLPAIAVVGLAGALLAVLAAGDATALLEGTMPSSRFHRAILLEQVAGWSALFIFAQVLIGLDARRRADG